MWSSLILTAALGVAQPAGNLQLTNSRLTIGELGPTRTSTQFLPGDLLVVGFDIEGLTIDGDGTAKYTMGMEVQDAAGKPIFKQDPADLTHLIPLRGNRIPARAFVTIGIDQPAGMYTCQVSVTDPKTKANTMHTVKFEILKKDFGIVAPSFSFDPRGEISAPNTGMIGQTVFLQFSVAAFARSDKTKQPNVDFSFEIFDDKKQPTLGQPATHTQDTIADEKAEMFAMRFPMFMSRPGKFTVKITATDKIAKRTTSYEVPVVVLPAN